MKTDREIPSRRPLSDKIVEPLPSGMAPRRAPLIGRFVRLVPADPRVHTEELYDASHRDADALKVWDFLSDGPWSDRAGFEQWLRDVAGRLDRVAFVIRSMDTGKACGMAQYLDRIRA